MWPSMTTPGNRKQNPMSRAKTTLPVDIVFHPSWWNAHAGITFDEDFFYHPKKWVESERKMEQVLYDRAGTTRHCSTASS